MNFTLEIKLHENLENFLTRLFESKKEVSSNWIAPAAKDAAKGKEIVSEAITENETPVKIELKGVEKPTKLTLEQFRKLVIENPTPKEIKKGFLTEFGANSLVDLKEEFYEAFLNKLKEN